MGAATVYAVVLVTLTGLDNQRIDINPAEVVSVRAPRVQEHFGEGIKCLLHTADGKFIAVIEDCDTVRRRLNEADQE